MITTSTAAAAVATVPLSLPSTTLAAVEADTAEYGGIFGIAVQVINALGEWGVGALTFIETVFPPIPSEVILPLAGYESYAGNLNLVLLLITSTLGAYAGALLLYFLGRWVGQERVIRVLSKLPLVDRDDFEKAAAWFHRHGKKAVFFGRLIPGVRSLISLPAGAERMPLISFSLFTLAGTLLWNSLLIGGGFALGTQYELVEEYAQYLDYVVYAAIAAIGIALVVRGVRRNRAKKRETATANRGA